MQALAIAEQLIDQIKQAVFTIGEKLPSERNLSLSFGCNRLTLQESLNYLESQGYIYSEKRKGWFIAPPPLRYQWHRQGTPLDFYAAYALPSREAETKRELHSKLLSIKTTGALAQQATLLGTTPLSPIYQIERIHYDNQHPVMVSVHYCLVKQFPKLDKQPASELGNGLYLCYQRDYQMMLRNKQLQLCNVAFPEAIAEQLLASKTGRALLLTHAIEGRRIQKEQHLKSNSDKEKEKTEEMGNVVELRYEYWRPHAILTELG